MEEFIDFDENPWLTRHDAQREMIVWLAESFAKFVSFKAQKRKPTPTELTEWSEDFTELLQGELDQI